MASEQEIIHQLISFKDRDKFSEQVWNNRGLNPPSRGLSSKLTTLFNICVDALIDAINNNTSGKQLKKVLQIQLSHLNKREYGTEEKEFICDLFYELAQILNVDFEDNAMRWLYGSSLNTMLKIQTAINPPKLLETKSQNCQNCDTALESFILRKEQGIPDYCWHIVLCKNCRDYSILSIGSNVKEFRFGNYDPIEQLPKEKFTREQAEVRLEQIRHFRK